jgi:hypothetical protein
VLQSLGVDELLGTLIDDWRVTTKVSEGAMGAVYEARRGEERAAVKVALPHTLSRDTLQRFSAFAVKPRCSWTSTTQTL